MLFKRIIIGLLLVGLIILNLFLLSVSPLFFAILNAVITSGGVFEMTRAFKDSLPRGLKVVLMLFALLVLPSYLLAGSLTGIFMLMALAAIAALVIVTFKADIPLSSLQCFALAMCYPALLLSFIYPLIYSESALFLLVCVFGIGPMSDTLAFAVGLTLKGPKLCPSVSPKKTISGAIGGLLGGLVAGVAIYLIFSQFFSYINIPPIWLMAVVGLIGSVFTQLGDLAESALKRKLALKDFGNLLPGHGGVLDRVDGIMFNAFFIYIVFTYIVII